jgi:hypothetical protein
MRKSPYASHWEILDDASWALICRKDAASSLRLSGTALDRRLRNPNDSSPSEL